MRWGTRNLTDVGSDPDYRFSLANERTFLAWIRTSLAIIAGGVAVLTLVPEFGPSWSRHAVGILLLLLASVVAGVSFRRWERAELALRTGQSLPPPSLLRIVSGGVAACALLVLVLALL